MLVSLRAPDAGGTDAINRVQVRWHSGGAGATGAANASHRTDTGHGEQTVRFEIGMVPDGVLELEAQAVSVSGCVAATCHATAMISRHMGMHEPLCSECVFTTNWAVAHFANWRAFLLQPLLVASQHYPPVPAGVDILEVGSFEGMSSIWLFANLGARSVTCVDVWDNEWGGRNACIGDHCTSADGLGHQWRLEARFDHNMRAAGVATAAAAAAGGPAMPSDVAAPGLGVEGGIVGMGALVKCKGPSREVLPRLFREGRRYDVIYVDGAHTAHDVLLDAVLAVRLLRAGGRMIFDDYDYTVDMHEAIDAFARVHAPWLTQVACGWAQACFVVVAPLSSPTQQRSAGAGGAL